QPRLGGLGRRRTHWIYGQANPDVAINTGLGVPATGGYANGEEGYYVRRYVG
ncbi:hypothetical protein HF319_09365, partial [Xanthomonas sp. Kuri4-1]